MKHSLLRRAVGATAVALLAATNLGAQQPGPVSPASLPPPATMPAFRYSPPPVGTPPAMPPYDLPLAPQESPHLGVPCPPAPPTAAPAPPAPKFDITWNNGLYFQTANKDFVARIGGVVHLDSAWYAAPESLQSFPGGTGRFTDGAAPRRLRLVTEGTMYQHFDYSFGMEFANGTGPFGSTGPPTATNTFSAPGVLDAFVTLKDVPWVGNVRVGNQKEPFGLEHLNSARYLESMERTYLNDVAQLSAFNNGRTPGVSLFRTWADDRLYTAVGVFKNISNVFGFGLGDGEYAVTGRVGVLPVYLPDDHFVWHVGGAMSYRDPANDAVRLRARSTVRSSINGSPLLNVLADTETLGARSQVLFGLENVVIAGPLSWQSEYFGARVNSTTVGGVNIGTTYFQGFYSQVALFLTGESRGWDAKNAVTRRIVPKRNFGFSRDADGSGGPGAWELAARYTLLDLNDNGIAGGRLSNVTLGVNWYWNPNMKMQFNYDYVYRDEATNPLAKGAIHSAGVRMALDF